MVFWDVREKSAFDIFRVEMDENLLIMAWRIIKENQNGATFVRSWQTTNFTILGLLHY